MGQDKPGQDLPPSDKPPGAEKIKGLGAAATAREKMNEYFELTERYVDEDIEEIADAANTKHPDRNTSKE